MTTIPHEQINPKEKSTPDIIPWKQLQHLATRYSDREITVAYYTLKLNNEYVPSVSIWVEIIEQDLDIITVQDLISFKTYIVSKESLAHITSFDHGNLAGFKYVVEHNQFEELEG